MRSNNLQQIIESITTDDNILEEENKAPGDTKKHKRRKMMFAIWKKHPWK